MVVRRYGSRKGGWLGRVDGRDMKADTERLSMEKMDRSLSDAMERAGQSLVRRQNKYPDLAVPETTETTPAAQENLVVANLERVDRIMPSHLAMVKRAGSTHKRTGYLIRPCRALQSERRGSGGSPWIRGATKPARPPFEISTI